jgi:hypothetical protein
MVCSVGAEGLNVFFDIGNADVEIRALGRRSSDLQLFSEEKNALWAFVCEDEYAC